MGQEASTATSKSSEAANEEPIEITYKDVRLRRRRDARMVQNAVLIWLDANIDKDNDDNCRNTITQLQRVVNNINTFTDSDQCIKFIETIDSDENKACIIISDSLGQHVVPSVHNMPQVDSIFILSDNKKHHEQWTKAWRKIKDVFTDITAICEALERAVQQCELNATPISFMATSDDDTNPKRLDQLDCSFMYTQILKDILLTINFEQKHIQEFVEHCCKQFAGSKEKLMTIEKLERDYYNRTAVWWYTCDSFLYRMLNSALRLMDVDLIIKLGFFITDLHRQLKALHTQQFGAHSSNTTFTLYRGQGMYKKDFERMIKTKGGLIAFNSFLSTSKKRSISQIFTPDALSNTDLMGILFVITIDPSQSTTPFASINEFSAFKDQEDEVLFSMHSVFRIHDIKPMGEHCRLYQVDLTLTNENDRDLRTLAERIEKEIEESSGWDRLGFLLLKMRQSKKAEDVYEILLEQTTDQIERATYYNRLAYAKYDQGEYQEALELNEQSLAIREQLLPSNHLDLAYSYNNIGLVYFNMSKYSQARSYYEKALAIRQKSLPANHSDLATSYNNIGGVYGDMREYSRALSYYEKALSIKQQSLPSNHPDLATCYNNMGSMHSKIGEYSKALPYYAKAVTIRQQSLPPNHPDLATCYNNMGWVFSKIGEYSKALSYYEKALTIRQQSLSSNHPDLAMSYNNIGDVYFDMDEYSKAHSSFKSAVEIGQQSLPSNHPNLTIYSRNLDSVKDLK